MKIQKKKIGGGAGGRVGDQVGGVSVGGGWGLGGCERRIEVFV